MASGSNSRGLVLLLITSSFFITGILFDYMPMIIDDHIKRTIELATNEEILSIWSKPPVDVNSYYWLYELINADEFQRQGQKAQVRQLGPFHVISRLEKRIVGLSANKFRLTYNSTRLMSLNESCSSELLDRPITAPNPYYASILEGVRASAGQLDGQTRAVAYGTIARLTERYNESILDRNTTARRLLLGRPMPIVSKLARLAETMGMGAKMPVSVSADQVASNSSRAPPAYGYVSIQNNTLSGPFEIYTGYQETARSLGELISYQGKRRLNYYDGKCNRMQASVGELRPMPVEAERRLEMFSPMLCRIVRLEPTGQQKLREGLAISYTLLADDFASAANNPDNRCFCTNSSGPGAPIENVNPLDDNHCSLDGLIDLGPCSYGAPLLMAPSSFQLDSRITNSLGSEFDPELLHGEMNEIDQADDKSQVVVLKRVGVPIRADITMTLFLRLVRDAAFKETATIPDVSYLPLMTVRESVTIPPKLAQIIINLESFISLTYHIKVVMYLSAVVLLFWLSGHYYGMGSERSGAAVGPNSEPDADGQQQQRNRRQTDGGQQQRRPSAQAGASGGGGGGGRPDSGGQPSSTGQETGSEPTESAPSADRPASERASPGQRRASSLLSGGPNGQAGRTLETVEEVAIKAAVAKPLDTNSNDRANSADSSRSLPPSRHTSRLGSLSELSSGQLEVPAAAAGSGGATNDLARSQAGAQFKCQPPARQAARIFSKVDEQFASTLARHNSSSEANLQNIPGPDDDPEQKGRPGESKLMEQPEGGDGGGERPACRRRRKNWFMNVYSNLVQMLNGLRGSVNEASQLELRPDSDLHQDKRLEMLAGRIDNWYNSNGDEQPLANPLPSGLALAGRSSEPDANQNSSATKTTSISSAGGQTETPATSEVGRRRLSSSGPRAASSSEAPNGAADSGEPAASSERRPSGGAATREGLSSMGDALETSARSDPTGIGAETQPADFSTERQFVSDSSGEPHSTTTTTSATTRANEAPISSSSPPPQVPNQTAASGVAGESLAEANPTERNGLNSRSMRVESAARAGEDVEGSAEVPGDEGRPDRAPPPSGRAPNSPPSDGRREQKLEEERRQAAGDQSRGGPEREPAAEAQTPAGRSNAVSAADDEIETEPETELEAENEAANELDKAKTLDQIEAALDGSDEEFAPARSKTNGPKQRQSATKINSSPARASSESLADASRALSPIDNKIKVLHQSKAPTSGGLGDTRRQDELLLLPPANGASQLAIDGLNSTDRSRQSKELQVANGLADRNGGSAANGQTRQNMTNNNNNKHVLDGTNLKLVDELRDEPDHDHHFVTGQKLEAQLRTEHSSNALVSNLSPKSSGPTPILQPESRFDRMGKLIESEIVHELEVAGGESGQLDSSKLSGSEVEASLSDQSASDDSQAGRELAKGNHTIERKQMNHGNNLERADCSDPTAGHHKQPISWPGLQIKQIAGGNDSPGSTECGGNSTSNKASGRSVSLRGGPIRNSGGHLGARRGLSRDRRQPAAWRVTSLKQAGGHRQLGWLVQPAGA